jgi:hypothetical protein
MHPIKNNISIIIIISPKIKLLYEHHKLIMETLSYPKYAHVNYAAFWIKKKKTANPSTKVKAELFVKINLATIQLRFNCNKKMT